MSGCDKSNKDDVVSVGMNKAEYFQPPAPLNTAVLFLVFNRPDTTLKVFDEIRRAKPPRLYIAADGPRQGKADEAEKVEKVREITNNIDWQCEVKTLFNKENLGCKYAVSGAIAWFFENEEEGIILEDDCIPSQSFFWYCEELLEKYSDDKRVGLIAGSNYFFGDNISDDDYYFSMFPFIWGWATWKRVWNEYDVDMKNYTGFRKNNELDDIFCSRECVRYFENSFNATHDGRVDSWAYPWSFMMFKYRLLSICPSLNLISNIGFSDEATHTKSPDQHADMDRYELKFPLNHPEHIFRSLKLDKRFEKQAFKMNIFRKIKRFIIKRLKFR